MSAKTIIEIDPDDVAKFLLDNGILRRINELIFHPRGLALSLAMDEDEEQPITFGPIFKANEPFTFDPDPKEKFKHFCASYPVYEES